MLIEMVKSGLEAEAIGWRGTIGNAQRLSADVKEEPEVSESVQSVNRRRLRVNKQGQACSLLPLLLVLAGSPCG